MAFRIGPNYNKEGPGVYLEDLDRSPITRFFQVLTRKFWRLCVNNLMFVIANIPMFIVSLFVVNMIISSMGISMDSITTTMNEIDETAPVVIEATLSEEEAAVAAMPEMGGLASIFSGFFGGGGAAVPQEDVIIPTTEDQAAFFYLIITTMLAFFILGMCLICMGPVQTALSYLYRNYAREIPTFTWSDFKDSFLLNWKDSLKAMGINFLVTVVFVVNIWFYMNNTNMNPTLRTVMSTIFIIMALFFMCINIFVYPMIASLELKIKHIYKNSLLFFMSRFLQTIGIFILNILLLAIVPGIMIFVIAGPAILVAVLYYLFIAFALTHYLNSFFVWQQIDRFIVKRGNQSEDEEKKEVNEDDFEEETESIPLDEPEQDDEESVPDPIPDGAPLTT